MNFGTRMKGKLKEQEEAMRNLSPEELYQACLNGYVENAFKIIETAVTKEGLRKGQLGACNPVAFNKSNKDIQTPLVNLAGGNLYFQPILKMTRREEGKFLSRGGDVYFTIDFTENGKRIYNDLNKLFKQNGVTLKVGFSVWDDDYDSTFDFEGTLTGNKPYSFVHSVANLKNYHLNKSVLCHFAWSL